MQKNDAAGSWFRYSSHLVTLAQAGMPVLLNCDSFLVEQASACPLTIGLVSVGARHAVPGKRTWRDGAIRHVVKIQSKHFEAACFVDGAGVRVARSGTAPRIDAGSSTCRAPTVGKKQRQKSRQDAGATGERSRDVREDRKDCGVTKSAQALRFSG